MNYATLEQEATEVVSSFAGYRLSAETVQALTRMGIETPTPIQAEALPLLLDGIDVIGQARTGSGKTLAFGIPALENVDVHQRGVQVLVLTPTRELAVQVAGVLEELGKGRGIKVGLLFGGRAEGPQRLMLKQGAHVVVGTPGRVLDMLNKGALWLDKVRFLVLDEADEMLDRGFAPDVERILDRTTTARQTAMFSATVPDWVRKTADRHLHNPETVAVDPNPEDNAPIDHIAYDVADGDKVGALKDLLDHQGDGSILVFGRTKHGVKKLARQLVQAGYQVAALQGNLSQNARDQVMADFRSGRVSVLLATNVAARGLDITHVEQVINFELPESHQLLTHRVGRTGRMGREGRAVTLLNHEDGAKWRQLERGLGRRIPRVRWVGAAAALNDTPESVGVTDVIRTQDTGRQRASQNGEQNRVQRAPRQDAGRMSQGAERRLPNVDLQSHAVGRSTHNVDRRSQPAERFAASGNTNRPRSIGDTTERPSGNRNRNRPQSSETRFEIECAACGAATTVPFEPTNGRPVYCRPCYTAMRPENPVRSRSGRQDIRSTGAETTYAD
ncbi:hypothetical protein BH24CHL4_BH24CHL4_23990 [soil metagenome]